MTHESESHQVNNWKSIFALSLGALGVVYGDIGTSPLYALKEIFFSKEGLTVTPPHVYGAVSTVIWALTLIVTIKYVVLVLRADHEAEGGVFALYARVRKLKIPGKPIFLLMLIFAAGLLFGDGVITPAISVISAVEGLGVATPALASYVVPITIVILTGLFAIQKNGTSSIGKIFGPVMLMWFGVLSIMGVFNILKFPAIIGALSPINVIYFVSSVPFHELLIILGFVMLVVTGGEAMFADLGHFGRLPIRLSWLTIAYPALTLNYLGQGAYLLSGEKIISRSIFYSMVPSNFLYLLIILSTMAAIIASQALITGAYSLSSQAMALDLLPTMTTKHTHKDHKGQIYMQFISIALYVGCIILVLSFKSSTNLASAYGLAESGVMLATTISVALIAKYGWKWKVVSLIAVFVPFLMIDVMFMTANSLKLFEGGFVPLSIGLVLLGIMVSWRWGMNRLKSATQIQSKYTVRDLLERRINSTAFVPKTVVIVADQLVDSLESHLPPLNEEYLSRYELMPEHLLYLTVKTHHEPYMSHNRIDIVPLDTDPTTGTILSAQINYGFMEEIDLRSALKTLREIHPESLHSDLDQWVFHVLHPRPFTVKSFHSLKRKIEYFIFKFLYKNSMTTEDFLRLNASYHVTAEVVPVKLK